MKGQNIKGVGIRGEKLSLNVQHDYISLKTPTGNFTHSWNGAKMSGEIMNIEGAFERLDDYITKHANKTLNLLDKFKELLNPDLMDKIASGWDVPKVVDIKAGDTAKFTSQLLKKKYPDQYKVVDIRRKYATLEVPVSARRKGIGHEGVGFERIGFSLYDLEKVN